MLYVDPGTGSYLLQVLAAGFFGLAFGLRQRLASFMHWIRRRRETTDSKAKFESTSTDNRAN